MQNMWLPPPAQEREYVHRDMFTSTSASKKPLQEVMEMMVPNRHFDGCGGVVLRVVHCMVLSSSTSSDLGARIGVLGACIVGDALGIYVPICSELAFGEFGANSPNWRSTLYSNSHFNSRIQG